MKSDTGEPATTLIYPNGPFPQPFGRYRLLGRLGSGGMGTVYRAHDSVLDFHVAIKIPHAHLMEQQTHRDRFLAEARAAALLIHPNFCRVLDAGVHHGLHYLAMDFVAGRPLSQVSRPSATAAAELVHTLAAALAAAHSQGVLHRDLKPSNILIDAQGQPHITDFGLALRLDRVADRLTEPGVTVGTPVYMAPEQFEPSLAPLGPPCDVYSLGVIFYELLTGRVPFESENLLTLIRQVVTEPPPPPARLAGDLDPVLEFICLKALEKRTEDRFRTMDEFALALAEYLGGRTSEPAGGPPRLLVPRDHIRFLFVGYGEHAPAQAAQRDRLFLDVGNDLRAGVIDHHHQMALSGSTASLVLHRPELVAGAVNPRRRPDDAFTLVLHEQPDLDGLAAAFLSIAYLCTGTFPPGSEALARYVDKVDEGSLGMTLANPFSLYAAFKSISNRLLRRSWSSNQERWQESVRLGLAVVEFATAAVASQGVAVTEVDAFECPGLFGPEDRGDVLKDVDRYHAKLKDPHCRARRGRLRLPGQLGGTLEVESLRVRDVQNVDDPNRCMFFKDWARSDTKHSPNGKGFEALSVFMSEGPSHVRRCILSVKPDSGASLCGLGQLLDEAEAEKRRQVFGVDDRVTDPSTGAAKVPRPGYGNADPWYDGRAQGYTIVDAPRGGTFLTADEIEALFLRFGRHAV